MAHEQVLGTKQEYEIDILMNNVIYNYRAIVRYNIIYICFLLHRLNMYKDGCIYSLMIIWHLEFNPLSLKLQNNYAYAVYLYIKIDVRVSIYIFVVHCIVNLTICSIQTNISDCIWVIHRIVDCVFPNSRNPRIHTYIYKNFITHIYTHIWLLIFYPSFVIIDPNASISFIINICIRMCYINWIYLNFYVMVC